MADGTIYQAPAKFGAPELRELISYHPETGRFLWRVGTNQIKAGDPAGSVASDGRLKIKVLGRTYLAHRLAWLYVYGEWPPRLDHEDRNSLNNRIGNLRPANRSQNGANQGPHKRNSLRLKGVRKEPRCERWIARIRVRGVLLYLGCFLSPAAAACAYDAAAIEHFGEYACVNYAALTLC